MSLVAWFPLNGNTDNYGISNTALTLHGTANYLDAGKIGKTVKTSSSFYFDSAHQASSELSLAFWVYPDTTTLWLDMFSIGTNLGRIELTDASTFNYNWYQTSNGGTDLCASGVSLFKLGNQQWYHIAMTADGANVKFYVNGELKKTLTQTGQVEAAMDDNLITWARRGVNSSAIYTAKYNDIRIYDHALSVKEVKEISKGLVLHYNFEDEEIETTRKVYDSSGYGYNGTNNGVTLSNDSSSGRFSAQFASNAYIEIPSLPQLDKVTYSMWVKIPSNADAYRSIFIPKGNPTGGGIWLSVNTEGVNLWAYQGGNTPNYCKGASTLLSADTWYLYTHTFDGTTGQNYLNGVAVGSAATYTTRTYIPSGVYTLGDSYTGTSWNGTPFDGKIADFKIYATALSAADILAEYNRKAAIDKNGNLFTGEIIEDENSQELLWTYKGAEGIKYRSSGSDDRISIDTDKSVVFTNHVWAMSDMIPVTANEVLYYDITYSNAANSHLYVGLEQFNSSGGSNSNEGCAYLISDTGARNHYRVKGTFTVSATADSSPTTKIRLRILNDWDSTAINNRVAKIHHISLRRISSIAAPKIDKNNYISANDFREYNYDHQTSLYKDGFVAANEIKEL